MVHELDAANNYFCIYEKIKFAPFFWPTLYDQLIMDIKNVDFNFRESKFLAKGYFKAL